MKQTAQDFFIKGIALCKEDKFDKAIDLFSQALSVDQSHTDALYNRAKTFFKLRLFDKALADFDQLITRNPDNAFYYSERAVALHLSGDNEKALHDLDTAVALEPDKPFRYSSRAFIKERSGDLKGAIEDYEKTIALDPDDAIAYNNKGLIEEKLGYLEQSKQSFAKADRLDPAYDKSKTKQASTAPEQKEKKPVQPPLTEAATGDKVTVKSYLTLVKNIVTTQSERKAFKQFLKDFIRKKS